MVVYAGIDLGKRKSQIHVMTQERKVVETVKVDNDPTTLRQIFRKYKGEIEVACEACSNAFWVADTLATMVRKVHVGHTMLDGGARSRRDVSLLDGECKHGSMSHAGKPLELLISMIERALGPDSAEVIHPFRLPDTDTGQPREVDIAIRTRAGSAQLLVVVECRDRKDVEDVRWVEELAQKRSSVKADKVIAVSTGGFTEPARMKAAKLNVDIRELNNLTLDDIKTWCSAKGVRALIQQSIVHHCLIFCDGLPPPGSPEMQEFERLKSCPMETAVFSATKDRRLVSSLAIWNSVPVNDPIWRAVPVTGEHVRRRVRINFTNAQDRYCVCINGRDWHVVTFEFLVELWYEQEFLPFRVVSYNDELGSIAEAATAVFDVGGATRLLALTHTPGGMTRISVRSTESQPPQQQG